MSKQKPQEPLTTYTVKGRKTNNIWEFKYSLNGILKSFKILEDEILSDEQLSWLKRHFPYKEATILQWKEKIINIEVLVGLPDLSFDAFWGLYNYKVGKANAQKQWNKLSEADKMNAIKSIKAYDGFIKRKQIAKVYPERYLKHRRFEDQFNSIH